MPRNTKGKIWKSRLARFAKRFAILVLTAIASGYGYMRYDFVSNADRLGLEISEARSLGLPIEPRDMERNPPILDTENAATLYETYLPPSSGSERPTTWSVLSYTNLWDYDTEVLNVFRPYLSIHRGALGQIRRASKLPHCDFKKDWTQGPNLLFPEFARLKSVAKWLAAEAYVAGLDGNWKLALDNVAAIGRIARHSGQDRIYMALLVETSVEAIAIRAAEELSSMSGIPLSRLIDLREILDGLHELTPITEYLEGEAFSAYWCVRNLGSYTDQADAEAREMEERGEFYTCGGNDIFGGMRHFIFPPGIERDLVERANSAECLSYWNESFRAIRNSNLPLSQIGEEMDRFAMAKDSTAKPWMRLTGITMPVFSQSGTSQIKRIAARRCTLALLDALIYRRKNGRLPSSLVQVNAELDPFTEQPLRFKRTSNGFRIYSVGENRADNSGDFRWEVDEKTLSSPEKNDRPDDWVACYPSSDRDTGRDQSFSKAQFFESIKKLKAFE